MLFILIKLKKILIVRFNKQHLVLFLFMLKQATSSSSASATSAHSDPAVAAQVSFAQMLKHEPVGETLRVASSGVPVNKTWPALDQLSLNTAGTNVPAALTLGGWVSMAKKQQQQMNMSGRAKRCQNAPAGDELGVIEDEHDERESMPAPSYKQSFFSAIDESLRLIESSRHFYFCIFLLT